jgi:hypothetical protein
VVIAAMSNSAFLIQKLYLAGLAVVFVIAISAIGLNAVINGGGAGFNHKDQGIS